MIKAERILEWSENVVKEHGFDLKEMYTKDLYKHCEHVAMLSIKLGKEYELSLPDLIDIGVGGLLHDIGKIQIPEEILNKPSKLNDDEWNVMVAHPELGRRLLKGHHLPETVEDIVLYHHEKLDGSGYPYLPKEPVLYVQLVTVADIYDGIHAKRCYHESKSGADTINIMRSMPGLNKIAIDILEELVCNS